MLHYKPTKVDAIRALGYNVNQEGDNYDYPPDSDGNEVTPPTEDAIQTKLTSLINDWEKQEYQRTREPLYPEIREQLDLLYHDMASGKGDKTGEWYKTVKKIKDDNPKPE
jgi:hypothetical protein